MKNRFLPVCASAVLLLAGCAVEETPMEGGSIAAVMEDIQTRTAVTDEGTFTWSAGDQVWLEITANPGYVTGTLSSGAGTGSANFAYGSHMGARTGKAVYPFNSGHDVNGNGLTVVLPASYNLGSNLSNTNAAMYGVEADGSIKFNHLAGVMRFKFRNVPVGTDKFILTLDKKINGTFSVDLTEEHPALQTESTSNVSEKSITLNFDALTSVQDIMLYVPLPLGTYTTLGLEVKAGSQSVWSYSNTVTNTINRKSLILMPTVTLAGSISGDIEGSETPEDPQEGDYVDEYGINHGQGVEIDGVVWAPVNCGYHATDYKYGKLYQWGRKYGQGYDGSLYDVNGNQSGTYSDASVPSNVSGPVSLSVGQSESNTNKFYKSTSSPYDWITPQDDALWNSGTEDDPVKTEYDPCPEGWRVPTYAELSALKANKSSWTTNDSQNGYWFSGSTTYSTSVSSVFFPAAGCRRDYDGNARDRGYNGLYWSSRPFSNNASTLSFYSGDVGMGSLNRAYGLSVRCVQDLSTSSTPADPIVVDLSSNGTANSYIVSEAGSYSFSPTKGNSNESVGAISSVDVLWESFGTSETPSVGSLISSVSYADGKISFSTPQNYREGNAVIAAKDASGTILWSWHIWLTDEPEGQVYYNNAGTMMDRNLGATSATPGDVGALGLLYQWGRKDPFLGSSSISSSTESKSTITWPSTVSSNSSNGTVEYATSHPTTFITYNDSNCDWYYTGSNSTNDTRWQSEKTIYDPCPVGWRVPDGGANGVWSTALGSSSSNSGTYDSTNKGINFSSKFGFASTIWYPALGSRYDDSGRYWSVTPGNDLANGLSFDCYGNVLPSSCGFRASGFGVRCQKEGTGGGLQIDVTTAKDLSALGTANSYIVSNKGTYSISAVKGNSGVSVGAITSVEVLWESYGTDEKPLKGSLVSCAKYENGKVYFKTSDTYREGNAVIAAKDASGEILWSWHIWLTDEPEGQVYYNNAGTMMDRNLGATSATPGDVGALGLLYQWGRKDPFLGSSSISSNTIAKSTLTWPSAVTSSSSTGTVDYVTSHPTTYVFGVSSTYYDWHYSSYDNNLWKSEKTIYDPCPVGWRVPDGGDNGVWSTALGSSSDFEDYTLYDSTNEGMNFSGRFGSASTIWYPASGYRFGDDGSLRNVDYSGHYWSASPINISAYYLNFNDFGSVYPSFGYDRAGGCSVRCLQE